MIKHKPHPLLFSAVLAWAQMAHGASQPVRITSQRTESGYRLIADNPGPAPVSLRVELTAQENLASDVAWPKYALVPVASSVTLAHFRAAQPGMGLRFSTRHVFAVGDYTALHDDNARYRMPFADGNRFLISQASDGPLTTHTTPESRNAIDITMPEGTPIVAARDGVIVESDGSHTAGGTEASMLSEANVVRIAHDDGTVASYAHLAPGGTYVQAGQRVLAGMVIGLAGSTGFSTGPHLHFAVTQIVRSEQGFAAVSVPVTFTVGRPAVEFAPRTGLLVYAVYDKPSTPTLLERSADKFLLRENIPSAVTNTIASPSAAPLAAIDAAPRWRRALARVPWWQWCGLIISVWLLALVVKSRRARDRSLAVASAAGARSRAPAGRNPTTAMPAHARLIAACGGDRAKAARLMAYEHRASQTMTNEEAAQRALERLMRG